MNKFYTALVAITAVALMVPAAADDVCYTTSSPEVDTTATGPTPATTTGGTGMYYVDNDPCQPVIGTGTCTFSIWVYEETNGIAGLQRGDEVHSDVAGCTDGTQADAIIF